MYKSKYNPEVDFWRFVFAVVIFLYHSAKFIDQSGSSLLSRGYLAVEFFFIVSGFFMASTIRNYENNSTCWEYLLHKIKSIYLYYICALVIAIAIRQWILSADGINIIKNIFMSWNEIFLLKMGGINSGRSYNGPTWYISAMLIAMGLLYPLVKKWRSYFMNVGALLISIFGYAIISQSGKTLNVGDLSLIHI